MSNDLIPVAQDWLAHAISTYQRRKKTIFEAARDEFVEQRGKQLTSRRWLGLLPPRFTQVPEYEVMLALEQYKPWFKWHWDEELAFVRSINACLKAAAKDADIYLSRRTIEELAS